MGRKRKKPEPNKLVQRLTKRYHELMDKTIAERYGSGGMAIVPGFEREPSKDMKAFYVTGEKLRLAKMGLPSEEIKKVTYEKIRHRVEKDYRK